MLKESIDFQGLKGQPILVPFVAKNMSKKNEDNLKDKIKNLLGFSKEKDKPITFQKSQTKEIVFTPERLRVRCRFKTHIFGSKIYLNGGFSARMYAICKVNNFFCGAFARRKNSGMFWGWNSPF